MKQYSFLMESNNKIPIQELVKDEEWQKLRSSLVGTWKTNPERNCKLLRQYLGDIHTCEYKKLRIVLNYLTGSGFRIGIIKHPCIDSLRNEIKSELNKRFT